MLEIVKYYVQKKNTLKVNVFISENSILFTKKDLFFEKSNYELHFYNIKEGRFIIVLL